MEKLSALSKDRLHISTSSRRAFDESGAMPSDRSSATNSWISITGEALNICSVLCKPALRGNLECPCVAQA